MSWKRRLLPLNAKFPKEPNRGMEKLCQLKREAVTALEKSRVSRIEKLHPAKASVVSFEKELDRAFDFSNNLVESGSIPDIMQNKKNVQERIEDLIKTTMPALPVSSRVEFVSTPAREFESGIYEIRRNRCARMDRERTGSEFPSWCRSKATDLSQNKRRSN